MLIKPDIPEINRRLDAIPGFQSMCFQLFRQWSANVRLEMPDWEPDLSDEQAIIRDVRNAFHAAIPTYFDDPKEMELVNLYPKDEIVMLAYAITGFVQGSLSTKWSLRYLPKPPSYYQMLWMKSIHQYFAGSPEAAQHVNGLYTGYKEMGFLINPKEEYAMSEEDAAYYKSVAELQFERHYPEVLLQLWSLMMDHFLKFKNDAKEIDLGSTMQTFTEKNMVFLLAGDWVEFYPVMQEKA